MLDQHNRQQTAWEPWPKDEVHLLDPSGHPSGFLTRVRRVLSSDRRLGVHEVLCDNGRTLYITRAKKGSWQEVDLDL